MTQYLLLKMADEIDKVLTSSLFHSVSIFRMDSIDHRQIETEWKKA